MLFSSVTFLYYFLPVVLALYFIVPTRRNGSPKLRNIVLLAASLVFYAWGEPKYVFLMAAQCAAAWALGLAIHKFRGRGPAKAALAAQAAVSLGALLYYKYADFFIANVNGIFGADFQPLKVIMPIGISFYTFQILSYGIDLYRGKTDVQRSLIDFSTYVALFPQLIAGPIVRYSDVAQALSKRAHSLTQFAEGARRFVMGLAKKVLIANVLGELVDIYKNSGDGSALFSWIYVVAYSLHIYFDFSGYSDMAIGLGRIFGFQFPENFNYPYIAKSITDFWRRWHMTLGGWFRDYVYIPLGGNRVKAPRHVFNILVVWMLTGFWHGAAWNFMAWGAYFGVLLLLEKFFLGKLLDKAPRFLRHVYVLLIVFFSWIFFDGASFASAGAAFASMFGFGAESLAGTASLYYLRSYMVPIIIGIIGSTPAPKLLAEKLSGKKIMTALEPLAVGVLLLLTTAYLVDGSFNPFIYFRF